MNLINFTHLVKLVYVSIEILGRLTMEDREHTHCMRIYSKICTSIKEHMNKHDKSLKDGSSIVIEVPPRIFLVILGHFYRF